MKINLKDKLELTYGDIILTLPISEILSGTNGLHSVIRRGVYRPLTGIKLIKDSSNGN